MVGQAVGAILSGQATTVLVVRGLNGRSGRRFGLAAGDGHDHERRVGGSGSYDEFFGPYGMLTPGQIFAMMARRHMLDFGTTAEQFAHIALTCRARANANPRAQMHDRPLTLDDCLSARMIAAPLRLYDFCLETDGACAVVVTRAERAADCRQPSVLIRAVAQASIPDPQPRLQFPVLMRESITELPARSVAATLYRRAGLGPDDVDVAQVYDCFTITVLLQMEDWGFCKKGEGGPFVAGGEIDIGGQIPINTGGGHLSEGYIHGMNHVVEGVRQVRGTSTSQVPGAEVCLITSTPLPPGSGLLLRAA
jgi:acetyl-CoA acetyltransferase